MPDVRPEAPPPDLSAAGKRLWRAAVRQCKRQDTWVDTDVAMVEAFTWCVLTARAARDAGDHKLAGESQRDAHRYATALLLTPEARKRHGVKSTGAGEDELAALIA